MNIRQLEVFVAVMSEGAITDASKKLFITQPSVSKYIKLLEEDLGFPLFDRQGNKLTPTAQARALYAQAEQLYVGLGKLNSFVESMKAQRGGQVSIASLPMLSANWLPCAIAGYLKGNPLDSVSLLINTSDWIVDCVASHRVDLGLGILFKESVGLDVEPLMKVPFVCVLPEGHPLQEKDAVTEEDLTGECLITLSNFNKWQLEIEALLEARKIVPKRQINVFSSQTSCQLAAAGAGVALVDKMTASCFDGKGIVIRRFFPEIFFDISMLTSSYRSGPPLVDEIKRHLKTRVEPQYASD
ncbi:LysR family transcriptional regulator [Halomonas sp. MCCC 1A11036]|uniref:LysR family transcriptional regulator n=1 Tax=Billgrantia zhangzhouensis TaxID=2733481 RepID=A0ABS9AFL8_9GAMM|nr:LysR substrate-binding domain-containing protein [Halomonas zhangzhouensis]MCE8020529.1 LysR family transcriptional regulator [Halomonas zhangzhouensis]